MGQNYSKSPHQKHSHEEKINQLCEKKNQIASMKINIAPLTNKGIYNL